MRVKTEQRRQAIIRVAGNLFLRDGYAAVSMAGISEQVGGSRMTLYNYFPNKEALFTAFVIEAGRERAAALIDLSVESEKGLRSQLCALGRAYLQLVLDPKVVAIQRLIIGEALRFPELARIFYEHGPKITLMHMMQTLDTETTRSQLRQVAPDTLALHFTALCEAGLTLRHIWGLNAEHNEQEIDMAVSAAVDAFLMGYQLPESQEAASANR